MGCYSFANHVLVAHPGVPSSGFEIPTVLEALRAESPGATIVHEHGCDVEGDDSDGIRRGRGRGARQPTSRSSSSATAPGSSAEERSARATTSSRSSCPACSVSWSRPSSRPAPPSCSSWCSGRPYVLDWAVGGAGRAAAVVQAFFPGEEGGPALASILSGAAAPSGRLPVSLPRSAGAQPYSYLHPRLGGPSEITSVDSTPVLPFGHGLSYTTFAHEALARRGTRRRGRRDRRRPCGCATAGTAPAADVVQLYARDVSPA